MPSSRHNSYKRPFNSIAGSFFALIFLMLFSCKAQHDLYPTTSPYHFPQTDSIQSVIHHLGYSLLYNEQHEQAAWVAYINTPAKMKGTEKRKDAFKSDPAVQSGSAENTDYYKSGFDRGHLAPAGDMKWSKQAMEESFYLSNMSPQAPSFNRGIWKKLEDKVRGWTENADSMYVVTGPVLIDSLKTIGKNKVSIPEYFFKVLLRFNENQVLGIAFLFKNEGSANPLSSFAMTIDELETILDMNFFQALERHYEKSFEDTFCADCWFSE